MSVVPTNKKRGNYFTNEIRNQKARIKAESEKRRNAYRNKFEEIINDYFDSIAKSQYNYQTGQYYIGLIKSIMNNKLFNNNNGNPRKKLIFNNAKIAEFNRRIQNVKSKLVKPTLIYGRNKLLNNIPNLSTMNKEYRTTLLHSLKSLDNNNEQDRFRYFLLGIKHLLRARRNKNPEQPLFTNAERLRIEAARNEIIKKRNLNENGKPKRKQNAPFQPINLNENGKYNNNKFEEFVENENDGKTPTKNNRQSSVVRSPPKVKSNTGGTKLVPGMTGNSSNRSRVRTNTGGTILRPGMTGNNSNRSRVRANTGGTKLVPGMTGNNSNRSRVRSNTGGTKLVPGMFERPGTVRKSGANTGGTILGTGLFERPGAVRRSGANTGGTILRSGMAGRPQTSKTRVTARPNNNGNGISEQPLFVRKKKNVNRLIERRTFGKVVQPNTTHMMMKVM